MLLADWVSRTEQGLMLLKALKALSHAAVSVSQYNQINPILKSTETEIRHGRHIRYILLNSVKSYCASICRVCRWGTSIPVKKVREVTTCLVQQDKTILLTSFLHPSSCLCWATTLKPRTTLEKQQIGHIFILFANCDP